jgi:hypothetical protein
MSYLRMQLEETPRYEGAATTAPFRLATETLDLPITSGRITPNPSHLDRADELRNLEAVPPRLPDAFEPEGGLAVRAYPKALTWLFELAGWIGVATAGNGIITDPDAVIIPTGATRWVFNKRTFAANAQAQSAQILATYSEASTFLKGQGYGISNLTLNAAGEVGADLAGLVTLRTADPVVTPTFESLTVPPFRRADLQIQSWLTGTGETDDFTVAIANGLVRRKSFGLATRSYYPDKLFPADERVLVTGTIPKYALDPEDVDALLAASTFSAKARWQSDVNIGATGYKYAMWLEMPACQLVGGQPDELANRRRYGANYDWLAALHEGSGFDAKITLVNATSAIKTYA